MDKFNFQIFKNDSSCAARTGRFETPHGSFETPCFMPCGTKGAVKTLTPDELKSLGCEIILGNTFHLMLRPGGELVQKMGGLQHWTKWNGPMLTDSGGFQVFSLLHTLEPHSVANRGDALAPSFGSRARALRSHGLIENINDDGVTFRSPIDGSTHYLTPEKAIEIQEQLGADIIMAFDHCPPGDANFEDAKRAMKRTHEWAKRCMKAKTRSDQALFPIIQGGIHTELRTESAKFMAALDSPGIAIGGVAVGEPKPYMQAVVECVMPLLPTNKPRYLMGIGEPLDILENIARGVDMFDCVAPTRLARHGNFWTQCGRRSIMLSEFTQSEKPMDETCQCYTCQRFSLSYLRHLTQEKEMLSSRLLTIHNLHFLLDLIRQARSHIHGSTLNRFIKEFSRKFHEEKIS
ncbi:MAG: tRNA guanosine(34) transglycosylase Tgt [Patescibacteria group bacterium]